MEKEIKKCEDCVFYIQHYRKDETRFRKMLYGHCVKPNGHFKKTDKICKDFSQKNIEKIEEEQLKSVAELLSIISKKISNLQEIFKE